MTEVFDQHIGTRYAAYHADTVEFTATMPEDSIGLSVYSPPFSQLYVYSESERDMGNANRRTWWLVQAPAAARCDARAATTSPAPAPADDDADE